MTFEASHQHLKRKILAPIGADPLWRKACPPSPVSIMTCSFFSLLRTRVKKSTSFYMHCVNPSSPSERSGAKVSHQLQAFFVLLLGILQNTLVFAWFQQTCWCDCAEEGFISKIHQIEFKNIALKKILQPPVSQNYMISSHQYSFLAHLLIVLIPSRSDLIISDLSLDQDGLMWVTQVTVYISHPFKPFSSNPNTAGRKHFLNQLICSPLNALANSIIIISPLV